MSFEQVVALYRNSPNSKYSQGDKGFSYSGVLTSELDQCITDCLQFTNPRHGRFDDEPSFSQENTWVEFTFILPVNELGRFYYDMQDFITNHSSLKKGEFGENFYICSIDFFSEELAQHEDIDKIKSICSFIQFLIVLSDGTHKNLIEKKGLNIEFILHSSSYGKQITITSGWSMNDYEKLDYDPADLKKIYSLLESVDTAHIEEKKSFLRLSIAEMMSQNKLESISSVVFLMNNIKTIINSYIGNLDAYLSNFSFEKIKSEITNAHLKFATEVSSILNDITGKILSISIPFGIILIAYKDNSTISYFLSLIILIIFCVVTHKTIARQNRMRRLVVKSFKSLFDEKAQSTGKIKQEIDKAINDIEEENKHLKSTLHVFLILGYMPILCFILIWIYENWFFIE